MTAGFQVVPGVQVPDLSGIHEGFSLRRTAKGYQQLTVNVSAERLADTVVGLARCVAAPGFFVLEVPHVATGADGEPDGRWLDVHYLDGIDHARFAAIVDRWRDLLVDDGEVNFGFGSHAGYDEVFVGAYKVLTIFAEDPQKYVDALVREGFGMEDDLRTVWENFSPDQPGRRLGLAVDGATVQDCIAALGEEGLYFSERRPEPG